MEPEIDCKKCNKNVPNVIRNLNRRRKTLQNIQVFIIFRVQAKNPLGKGLTLFRGEGVFKSNLFEFFNIQKSRPCVKKFSLDDSNDLKLAEKKERQIISESLAKI